MPTVKQVCKRCEKRKCMPGGFLVCQVCFNENIKSPDIGWRKNYFPSSVTKVPKKDRPMKQCIKLDLRIDLEDGSTKVTLDSAYAPVDTQFMRVLQAGIRAIAKVFYTQLFESKTKVSTVKEEE